MSRTFARTNDGAMASIIERGPDFVGRICQRKLDGGEHYSVVRVRMLAACPSRPSASASAMIDGASFASASAVYRTTLVRFRNSYTLMPLEKRAVVLVGRQWLGPAT